MRSRLALCMWAIGSAALAAGVASLLMNSASAAPSRRGRLRGEAILLEAERAQLNSERAEIVEQGSFESKQGVSLKAGQGGNVGALTHGARRRLHRHGAETRPLLDPHPRRHGRQGHRADAAGRKQERVAAADDLGRRQSPEQARGLRAVEPAGELHSGHRQVRLDGQQQEIRVWLPEGVRLDYLQIAPYTPPKRAGRRGRVPADQSCRPPSRPRLWVNAAVAAAGAGQPRQGRERPALGAGREQAAKPFEFNDPARRGGRLQQPRWSRLRWPRPSSHLMAGDRKRGREAVALVARLPGGGPVRQPARHHPRDRPGHLLRRAGLRLVLRRDDARRPGQHPQGPDAPGRRHGDRLAAVPPDDRQRPWQRRRRSTATCSRWPSPSTTRTRCRTATAPTGSSRSWCRCATSSTSRRATTRASATARYRFGWDLHAAWLFRRMTRQTGLRRQHRRRLQVLALHAPAQRPDAPRRRRVLRRPSGEPGRRRRCSATPTPATRSSRATSCARAGWPGDPILILLLNDPDLPAEQSLDVAAADPRLRPDARARWSPGPAGTSGRTPPTWWSR